MAANEVVTPVAMSRKTPAPYRSPWMNDELEMFRKTVARFVREEFAPHEARWREQHRPDAEAWTKAGQTGILLTDVPEEYGGGGGTFAHEAVVYEELAKAGIHFGCGVHSIAAHYILSYGTDEQKHRWLPKMAKGRTYRLDRDDRAGGGFGPARHQDHRAARRQFLGDQRIEDLHHQWLAYQLDLPGGEDRTPARTRRRASR